MSLLQEELSSNRGNMNFDTERSDMEAAAVELEVAVGNNAKLFAENLRQAGQTKLGKNPSKGHEHCSVLPQRFLALSSSGTSLKRWW
mmetsp:Transcript_7655/g.13901  ORF Transcript_7655/g.13901 Transcript_7655/m.13901 type:complete len:87 (-) Transcript_7655:941-1201(-)